jgi:hypothetical protein
MTIAAMFAEAIVHGPSRRQAFLLTGTVPARSIRRQVQGLRLVPMSAALAWGLIPARALSQPGKFDAPTGRAQSLFGFAISLDFHQRVQRPGAVS